MRKIGIMTIASLAANVILSLWLVNQYFYDQYFHAYVDAALGPVYPFIVLTAGLGGGSSLGYLLLKRRRTGDETGKVEKAKLFKSSGPVQTGASSQGKILPTGPPPGQISRHTAYAVPPLPRSSSSAGASKGGAPSSISATAKTTSPPPTPSSRLEQLTQPSTTALNSTLRDQFRPESIPRPSPSTPPPPIVSRGESPPQISRIPPEPSRGGFPQQWKPEPSTAPDRTFDTTVFPRPGQMEAKPGSESSLFGSPLGQAPKPPQPSQAPFPVSKWTPPDQKGEAQWTDPVPKPGLAAPQKWAPPPGQGFAPRPPQGFPPRSGTGQAPAPGGQRPPYPQGQSPPPRPLGFPGQLRPGQPAPIGVPPPFRSDQPRPPPPLTRPMSSPGAPLPQPWSPQKSVDKVQQESQNKDFASEPARPSQFGPTDNSRTSAERNPEPSSPGGEMDWDTALDTILKTLKKDRGVGEKA